MADRYWVGGTGTWDTTTTTNWSASSGGSSGASAPTSVDNVIFDGNSNVGTTIFTVTITTSAVCQDISFGGGGGPLDAVMTLAGTAAWSIFGSMTLVSANLTVTYTGTITFASTTTGKTITTAGKTIRVFIFNGVGGGWTLQDSLQIASNSGFQLLAGAVNTNNQTVTATGGNNNFTTSGAAVRSLTLGTTTFNCSGIINAWNVQTTTNFTLSAASSTINLSGSQAPFVGGGLTYGTINFTGSSGGTIDGANTIDTININNVSFSTLTINAAQNITTFNSTVSTNSILSIILAGDLTIGTLNLSTASVARRIFLRSSVLGTTRTITATTITVSNADFRDITGAGVASWDDSSRTNYWGDCKGNSGITFATGRTVYWNLAGAQNWSAIGWALTSTGTPADNNFPLAQDTATFTDAGSVTGTITVNTNWNIGTVDMSNRTSAMTLATITTTPTLYGNWLNGSGTTLSGTGILTFSGRTTQSITSASKTFTQPITINSPGGTVSLVDALTIDSARTLTLTAGTFDAFNQNVTVGLFSSSNSNTRTLTMGSGTWTLSGTGTVWNFTTVVGLIFSGASSTINLTDTTTSARTFQGGGLTYGTLNIGGATGISTTTINGTNTFSNFSSTKTVAHTITFNDGQTITNWNVTGTTGNVVTLNTNLGGTARYNITYNGSQLNLDYLNISRIGFPFDANGLYRVYAGANSINGSATSGIAFIDGTTQKAYLLTTGTTWTVPADWNSSSNNIYLLGAGGGGGNPAVSGNNRAAGGGGGGGGFTALTNQSLTPAASIPYTIGTSATNTNGGSTTFNTTNIAGGGLRGTATTAPTSTGGLGGTGVTFNGGTGGAGAFGTAASTGYGAGGGAGPGGPNGVGGNGGNGFGSTTQALIAGGGGGGNGGGAAGGNASSGLQGNGGNNFAGIGGGVGSGAAGTFGGGNAGGVNSSGGRQSLGIDFFNTVGGGGGVGGAGGGSASTSSAAGTGGSGGAVTTAGVSGSAGAGGDGFIFIVYSLGAAPASTPVILSGVTIEGGVTIV